jgi:hypothetical protein
VSRELLCRVFVLQSRRRSVSWVSSAGAPPRCISLAVFVYSGARVRGSAALSLKRAADQVLASPCDRAAVGLSLRFPVARRRFLDFTPALGIVRLFLFPASTLLCADSVLLEKCAASLRRRPLVLPAAVGADRDLICFSLPSVLDLAGQQSSISSVFQWQPPTSRF